MKLSALLVVGLLSVAAAQQATDADADADADRDKRQSSQAYYGQQPRAAAPASAGAQLLTRFPSYGGADGGVSRNTVTASPRQQSPTRRPAPSVADNQREYQHQVPVYRPQPQPQQLQGKAPPPQRGHPTRQQQQQLLEDEELEEEEQKPDRLTELLPLSKFDCHSKKTGYYADDGLGCEVFHYCQENAKHSWICPEGFQFHQVHLICMPPSTDNICAQSSEYHFVNDYLYRPINTEEHLQKPNISLKYADRYYPENYYEESHEPQPQRHVVQTVAPVQQQQQQQQRRPLPQPIQRVQQYAPQPTQRPQHFPAQRQQQQQQYAPQQQLLRQQPNQVFHSSEEVNIPLQHRRPSAAAPPARTTNYQDRDDDEEEDEEEYEYEDPPYRQG